MITLIIRTAILFILILGVFRLMGKRQIGQMQPFELVLTLIIADLSTIPMSEPTIPLLHGIVPLLTLLVVHYLITIICLKSNKIDKMVNGKPIIVINPKGIDYSALKTLDISLDDLMEGIRNCNYFSFDEVEFAIVETTGKISVIPKSEYAPATLGALKIKSITNSLPVNLISEGQIIKDNIKVAGVDEKWIHNILKNENISNIKNVIVLTLDDNGKMYLQEKNKEYKVIKTKEEKAS